MKYILIILVLATIGAVYYSHQKKKEEDLEISIRANQFDNYIKKMEEHLSRDSSQLEWERKIRHLMYQAGHSEKQIEEFIISRSDSTYLLDKYTTRDTKEWYLKFRKTYHNR